MCTKEGREMCKEGNYEMYTEVGWKINTGVQPKTQSFYTKHGLHSFTKCGLIFVYYFRT